AERFERFPGLLAGGASGAPLPAADGERGEDPGPDAPGRLYGEREEDRKHVQAFLGTRAGFLARSISRNNMTRPTVIPLSATLKVGQCRDGRSQCGSPQCQSMKSIT